MRPGYRKVAGSCWKNEKSMEEKMSWTDKQIQDVWNKGIVVTGYDSKVYRKDICGHLIKFDEYGQETGYGWEIDHIYPVSKGGSDDLSNLQPLYWENNRKKGDTYPWNCE